MRSAVIRWLALLSAAVLLGFTSTQCLSRGDIYANANGAGSNLFTWISTVPSWSGSTQLATVSDFTAFVKNSGACPGSAGQVITFSAATGCAVSGAGAMAHALLTNPSFASASFASWSADGVTGSCTGANAFAATASLADDADGGSATASTIASCDTNGASFATVGLSQAFTAASTPTSQTWSLHYFGALSSAGDALNCSQNNGVVQNLVVKINGTTVGTLAGPTLDSHWHTFNGTTTAMVTGSNTLDVTVQISGAKGSALSSGLCRSTFTSQVFNLDAFSLQATW